MLLLNKEGYIIGINMKPDSKPSPLPIDGTKWNGTEWVYPPTVQLQEMQVPTVYKDEPMNAYQLLIKIQDAVHPHCGTKIKEKSDDITVLIPSYNKHKWVADAIRSALEQTTLKPYKVIVLAMTDKDYESAKSVESPVLEVIKSERKNASAARNYLVSICPTEYFVLLDADDLLSPNFLEAVRKEKASIVGVPCKQAIPYIGERKYVICGNLTQLLHKEVWNEIGGLREDLSNGGEDCFFLNEIFIQKKWLVDYTLQAWYDYRHVDEESLVNKDDHVPYILSVEKELWLHKDWYKDLLARTYEQERQAVGMALDDFIKKYNGQNDTGIPIVISYPSFNLNWARDTSIANRWNNALPLFAESERRGSKCVCKDLTRPNLYGRNFDLYVYAQPSLSWEEIALEGTNEKSCYVNNPELDINLPMEELLKNYCVVFSREQRIAPARNVTGDDYEKLIDEMAEKKATIGYGIPENSYTLAFFSKCNKKCHYCVQEGLSANLDEDTLYKNFLKAMDKLESIHGKNWRVNLSGGEITLCSDELAHKVMERLDGYCVQLLTNGNKYLKSPFYDYPNVNALVHLTEPPFDASFLRCYDIATVVANKKDLPELIKAINEGKIGRNSYLPTYIGNDKALALSDEDAHELNAALAEKGIYRPDPKPGNLEACVRKNEIFRQVNLWDLTVYPCCGFHEPAIPLDEWNLQEPTGKFCKDCPKYVYD